MASDPLGAVMSQVGGLGIKYAENAMFNQEASNAASINREWQGDQERSARKFTERMSSTAHQREVKDLEAAGLNPLLSANSGASTPSGGAPAGATAQVKSPLEGMSDTAMSIMRLGNDMETAKEQRNLLRAQTQNTNADTRAKGADAAKGDAVDMMWQYFQKKYKEYKNYRADEDISEGRERAKKQQQNQKSEDQIRQQFDALRRMR